MKGNKIILRPIRKSDLQILNKWKNLESVFMYLGGGYSPVSEDQQEKWMDSIIDLTGNNRRFMIVDENDKPIGMVGLYDISWIHRNCEIGVYIGEAEARGKGYASEACKVIESYAYEYLNLRKIKAKANSENVNALKLWKKLGYTVVGEYKQERYVKGRYCDVTLLEKFLK